jgi:hypothetical protein
LGSKEKGFPSIYTVKHEVTCGAYPVFEIVRFSAPNEGGSNSGCNPCHIRRNGARGNLGGVGFIRIFPGGKTKHFTNVLYQIARYILINEWSFDVTILEQMSPTVADALHTDLRCSRS